MLSVLVVEDEPIIRRKIVEGIDWEANDMGPVFEATDGRDALAIMESHQIDIMVTDIQMPGIDGIELIRKARASNRSPRVVVISGYAEFEYARASIQLNVEDYVLKPFRASKLLSVLAGVRDAIELSRQESARTDELRSRLENSKQSLRDKFFADLIRRGHDPAASQTVSYLGLDRFTVAPITVAILSFDDTFSERDAEDGEATLLRNLKASLSTRQQLESFQSPWYLLDYAADELVLIAGCEDWELGSRLESILPALVSAIGAELCIGIGRSCRQLQQVPVSYSDARAAARLRFLYGTQKIFYSRDINNADSRAARLSALQHTSLYDDLRIANFAGVVEGLPQLFAQLRDGDMPLIAAVIHNVVLTGCAIVTELGHNAFDIFGPDFNPFIDLNDFGTIEQMERWMREFFVTIDGHVASHRKRRNAVLVSDMKRYIEANYDSSLSLERLSRQFGISPSYVSVLFSTEAGRNFTDYVTEVRVTMAKQLLLHSTLHIYEIADEVGFRDAYYFSTCFKKVTGRTPSEYRRRDGDA